MSGTDDGRFFKEAEDYFYRLANERNLGLTLGRWTHPRYGELLVRAVSGRVGAIHVTLAFCATQAWIDIGQGRLWWYLNAFDDPFELKHVERRVPMAEVIINADADLDDEIGARLRWIEGQPSIEAAVTGIYGKALAAMALADEARDDVRVALAEEIPKGDEEEPA